MQKGIQRTKVNVEMIGFKYNMSNVNAVIGLVQMETIFERIKRHYENGKYFDKTIGAIPGLAVTRVDPEATPSYWIYTVLSDNSEDVERRMTEVGVSASKLHRPNHLHSVFGPMWRCLPGLETYYRRLTHIPCGSWLTNEVREQIVNALRKG
jgi:dTDP-4-amino-4,6-dideoxygalactose transaminase